MEVLAAQALRVIRRARRRSTLRPDLPQTGAERAQGSPRLSGQPLPQPGGIRANGGLAFSTWRRTSTRRYVIARVGRRFHAGLVRMTSSSPHLCVARTRRRSLLPDLAVPSTGPRNGRLRPRAAPGSLHPRSISRFGWLAESRPNGPCVQHDVVTSRRRRGRAPCAKRFGTWRLPR